MTEWQAHLEGALARLTLEMDVQVGLTEELTDRVASLEECASVSSTTKGDGAKAKTNREARTASLRKEIRNAVDADSPADPSKASGTAGGEVDATQDELPF